MSNPRHGNFGWYELMTTDPPAAASFYSAVIGWTAQVMGQDATPAAMPYTVMNLNGTGIAGIMHLPEQAGPMPAWLGYINVDDVDVNAERVVEAGGAMKRPPTDVPGMLRFAVVSDPQGAPYILFTPDPAMPTPTNRPSPGSPGTVGWHELMTSDAKAALAFYSSQYGWTKSAEHDMGPMGTYTLFALDGKDIGGIMNKPPNAPGSFWNFYFQVDGIDSAINRLTAAGGKVIHGPAEVPGGQWVVLAQDPQGANFALVSNTK